MLQQINKYWSHIRAYLFFILFISMTNTAVFAKSVSLTEAKNELNLRVDRSKEPTISCLYFFREHHQGEFKNVKEWYKLLHFLELLAREKQGSYYVQLCTEIGVHLQNNQNYKEAYYFLYMARTAIKTRPPKDERFLFSYYQTIGLSYYYFKSHNEARTYFLLSNQLPKLCDHDRIGILNTLGLINRDQGFIDSSKVYYEKALTLAKKENDSSWIGVLSGNLGHYYWLKKDLKKARELLKIDQDISLKNGQYGSAMNAIALLARVYLAEGKKEEARSKLLQLEQLLIGRYEIGTQSLYLTAKMQLQEADGNYKEALESYRYVVRYQDTISHRKDLLSLRKTEFQINFERKQAENSLLREKKKSDEILIYSIVGGSIAVISILILIITLTSKRRKREREIADLKHQDVAKELQSAEKEMRAILSNLFEKNELIEQMKEELDQLPGSTKQLENAEKIKLLDRLQSFTLLTDEQWFEFKRLFEKLNPNFFSKMLLHSPDLTNAEIRLVTLIKLNLSNVEMSQALGISPDSVRKTSLRLRKKLNMELHEELVKFILSI